MNKEIQEMAKIVGKACEMYDFQQHICLNDNSCENCRVALSAAEKLYNASYRKADEARKETAIEQARELIPDFESFAKEMCSYGCNERGYCGAYCVELVKAEKMDYERILKSYARNDGDLEKVMRYIRRARV